MSPSPVPGEEFSTDLNQLPNLVQDAINQMHQAFDQREQLAGEMEERGREIVQLSGQIADLEEQRLRLRASVDELTGRLQVAEQELERQQLVTRQAVDDATRANAEAQDAQETSQLSKAALERLVPLGAENDLAQALAKVLSAIVPEHTWILFEASAPDFVPKPIYDPSGMATQYQIVAAARWAIRKPGVSCFSVDQSREVLCTSTSTWKAPKSSPILPPDSRNRLKDTNPNSAEAGPLALVTQGPPVSRAQQEVLTTVVSIASGIWRAKSTLEQLQRHQARLEIESAQMLGRKRELEQLRAAAKAS